MYNFAECNKFLKLQRIPRNEAYISFKLIKPFILY